MVVVVATVGVEVGAAVEMVLVGTVGVIVAFLHVTFEVVFFGKGIGNRENPAWLKL